MVETGMLNMCVFPHICLLCAPMTSFTHVCVCVCSAQIQLLLWPTTPTSSHTRRHGAHPCLPYARAFIQKGACLVFTIEADVRRARQALSNTTTTTRDILEKVVVGRRAS